MSTKYYPPYIQGVLPAFEVGDQIAIPYSNNPMTPKEARSTMTLLLRNIANNSIAYTLESTLVDDINQIAYFDDKTKKLQAESFYKAQLAYGTAGTGYYSTVGTIKCCSPSIVKVDLSSREVSGGGLYANSPSFIGTFTTSDPSECIQKYKFTMYDKDNNVYATSEWQAHNHAEFYTPSNEEQQYQYSDEWIHDKDLQDKTYYLQYTIVTNNQLTKSSPIYPLIELVGIEDCFGNDCKIKTKVNVDQGCIEVSLTYVPPGLHYIKILRTEDEITWQTIATKTADLFPFADYTVEQGHKYLYAFQEFNLHNLYADKHIGDWISVDFEDMFLYDGEKQLRVRFNPKMSSFKTTLLETKTNTIGSQYPFIFRNGIVNYKEFPIGGLITAQFDNDMFLYSSKANYERGGTPATDTLPQGANSIYSEDNVARERLYKNIILDWLNDGKPKLLRTPTEGNFLVQLMNVQLQPMDQLGRLLHSFTANAVEIGNTYYSSLVKHNILNPKLQQKDLIIIERKELQGNTEVVLWNEHTYLYKMTFLDCAGATVTYTDNEGEKTIVIPTYSYTIGPFDISFMKIQSYSAEIPFSRLAVIDYIMEPKYDNQIEFHNKAAANYGMAISKQITSNGLQAWYDLKEKIIKYYLVKLENTSSSEQAQITFDKKSMILQPLEIKEYTNITIHDRSTLELDKNIIMELTYLYTDPIKNVVTLDESRLDQARFLI